VVRTGLSPGVVGDLVAKLCADGRAVSLGAGQGVILDAGHHAGLREAFVAMLDDYHRSNPLSLGMPREELLQRLAPGEASAVGRLILEGLAADGKVRLEKDLAAAAGHAVALGPAEERIREALEEQYRAADLNPPTLDEAVAARSLDAAAARRIYHLLLSRGRLVRIKDGKVFDAGAIERLKARLWELRKTRPVIDVAAFKELTGTSRKNAIPLLEHMDAERVTRRRQNDREILPPPGAETH
ncbi:MAG TPA: SelB C-terminal domain-containing protein, partial [Candidatus Saccharimonadales bacterium]|nr:SelB C-terminal domain-containing protein [Candidatus Saccharimonadales bacterium]